MIWHLSLTRVTCLDPALSMVHPDTGTNHLVPVETPGISSIITVDTMLSKKAFFTLAISSGGMFAFCFPSHKIHLVIGPLST